MAKEYYTLDQYMERQRLSGARLAESMGVSEGAISLWRRRMKTPSTYQCVKLMYLTMGKLSFMTLLSHRDQKLVNLECDGLKTYQTRKEFKEQTIEDLL